MSFKIRSQSQNKLLRLQKISFQKQAIDLRRQNSNRNKFNQILHKQKSRKKILSHVQQRKIVNVGNFLEPTKIISVTAHKWVIFDFYSSKYIRGYRAHDKCELNVFSKLLVFCALYTLILKHKIDISRFQIIVTKGVLKMFEKHKIWLCAEDIISLEDIMHLMILEQSQIYEVILSVNIGAYLFKKHKNQYYSVFDSNDAFIKTHLNYFYEFVNQYCQLMKLQAIKYLQSDPLLRQQRNFGSVSDFAKISMECMKISLFKQIINKSQFQAHAKFVDNKGHMSNKSFIVYNKTIQNNFIPYINICRNKGQNQFLNSHCSLYYQDPNEQIRPILVVLYNAYSAKDRQKDIQQIVEWYITNQNCNKLKISSSKDKKTIKTQNCLQEQIQNLLNKKIGSNLIYSEDNKSSIRKRNNKSGKLYILKTQI